MYIHILQHTAIHYHSLRRTLYISYNHYDQMHVMIFFVRLFNSGCSQNGHVHVLLGVFDRTSWTNVSAVYTIGGVYLHPHTAFCVCPTHTHTHTHTPAIPSVVNQTVFFRGRACTRRKGARELKEGFFFPPLALRMHVPEKMRSSSQD